MFCLASFILLWLQKLLKIVALIAVFKLLDAQIKAVLSAN